MTAEFVDACKLTDRERLDKMGLKCASSVKFTVVVGLTRADKAVMDVALNFTSCACPDARSD